MPYVELHARSAFSFLEGASLPEVLIATGAERGLPAIALLDRNGVYGAPRFHMAAKERKIKAHVGAEISIAEGGNYPLLVANRAGYQNLCRLITTTKLRTPKNTAATATVAELQSHAEGLICLTGDENGPLAHALANGGIPTARRLLQQIVSIFNDNPNGNSKNANGGRENVYIELQRHGDRFQEARNQAAIGLAREFRLPLLATNGVCYATPAERQIADVFTCLKNKRRLDTAGRLLAQNSQRYVRSAEEMTRLFADLPEAIANTVELSSRLDFSLEKLGYEFPRYLVPEGETMDSFLHKRTWDGARCRYRPVSARVRAQLEKELALIAKLKLAGYFLIVWDLVCFCERNGILVQGRGSAANSAVCYSLGITAIDPIGMDLLFERFLSEERGEWPDIDLDLPSGDEREKVIQYVYERYGQRGAAMTANVCTYRGRSAAREMGKVLGFDEDTLSRLSAVVGQFEWRDPNDTMERHFTSTGLDLSHPQIAIYLDLCQRVQDLPRHLSQHSGGMVICQGQLDSVVPLEPATMPGRVVVQWDKDDCADLGLIKVDLLGLGMMAVLKDSIGLIQDHYGEEVDLAHLPQDCPDVYDTIRKADTIGMFQIESCAQMASLPRNNPTKFYDLVTQVALIRPGPITGEMTSPYLKRRQGKEAVTYPHESLIPVLKRTLGVPLFQEQLLKLAMICANFSGGEAEELRRALGSKRSRQRMIEIEAKLRAGMMANNIPPQTQDQIVKFISSFALYGFPESHAASFALIAYASAFLKVRYLAAFTAALLNNWPMGFYHPATVVKDAQRHGLRVKPVDVMRSDWNCTIEAAEENQLSLRIGLRYVRGLQQAAAEVSHAAASTRALRLGRRSGASRASTQPRQSGYPRDYWRAQQSLSGGEPASPRRLVAGGEGRQKNRPIARRHRRTGFIFSSSPHERRRAIGRRLSRHRINHGPSPHGLSERNSARTRRRIRHRTPQPSPRERSDHRWLRDHAPASGNRQGADLHDSRRRNWNFARHHHSGFLRSESNGGSETNASCWSQVWYRIRTTSCISKRAASSRFQSARRPRLRMIFIRESTRGIAAAMP